jgi:hypothetical protein
MIPNQTVETGEEQKKRYHLTNTVIRKTSLCRMQLESAEETTHGNDGRTITK